MSGFDILSLSQGLLGGPRVCGLPWETMPWLQLTLGAAADGAASLTGLALANARARPKAISAPVSSPVVPPPPAQPVQPTALVRQRPVDHRRREPKLLDDGTRHRPRSVARGRCGDAGDQNPFAQVAFGLQPSL